MKRLDTSASHIVQRINHPGCPKSHPPTTENHASYSREIPGLNIALFSRREWIKAMSAAAVMAGYVTFAEPQRKGVRSYHRCLAPNIVTSDQQLVETVAAAGIDTIWLAGFFYGHRPFSDDLLKRAMAVVQRHGMKAELINVPLGHPGDSLGSKEGDFPLTPPAHWLPAVRPDGRQFVGTSLHEPATAENCEALRSLRAHGFRACFLDDDFRLARSPGEIGGCFCDQHRTRFLQTRGYPASQWQQLLDDIAERRNTSTLQAWVEFICDELSSSFHAQQQAFGADLGIMIMYLGAEKAGIRLNDYRRVPFRVGELMFNDESFGSPKGKTDELFSVLFHRRFADPKRAFSETTAFPADKLSARNMAAKLIISTLADVRHTMFMSGVTPFPHAHWETLAPAMKTQARFHEIIAGHKPHGPFKHYWGQSERSVGTDQPFSLWLALGVPFEVVETLPSEGWTFLTDFDARDLTSQSTTANARLVCRTSAANRPAQALVVEESLPALFAFKRSICAQLGNAPYIAENEPAVCAWYPTANATMVWNLSDEPRDLTLVHASKKHPLRLGPLAADVVKL
ncbi:MAG: hypothetical protein GX456_15110 [Verrucomicrobia bacterium]|nr:hypothetical protein [Verrucomicrobiota bacterium]